jgi:hypothetical protein
VAGCCECGDEPSGSCATELVKFVHARKSIVSASRDLHCWITAVMASKTSSLNPTLAPPRRRGGQVPRTTNRLWSTEAKVCGIMLNKGCMALMGDSHVAKDLFGTHGSTLLYVCLLPA